VASRAPRKVPGRSEAKDVSVGKDDAPMPPWLLKGKGRRRS
jgi:hypothetical protein